MILACEDADNLRFEGVNAGFLNALLQKLTTSIANDDISSARPE